MPILLDDDNLTDEDRKKAIARNYLRLSREDMDDARENTNQAAVARRRHILNARAYGLTWAEIGSELGITDTAARMIGKADH